MQHTYLQRNQMPQFNANVCLVTMWIRRNLFASKPDLNAERRLLNATELGGGVPSARCLGGGVPSA